ncbi:putative glycerophosphotransferase [Tetragenococcus halophilus subsp. halophilus]|uniref:CDP-glycerol glycerophosphotransferase family protein n=1 Tax=Tetragenococcus halophilus TaxID=51669 RepID=UPI000CB0867E|nr:CDP-glycerol glycerophosphotransferase family protein [Tetragenococcus halophilus]GBD61360.1 putative glycerophosphotransferase [Tetragenococcus halophilus subsp. halophilus]
MLVNKELSASHYYLRKTISKIKVHEEKLLVEGNLTTRFFDIESGQVEFIQRGGEKSVSFPVRINPNKEQKVNSFARRHVYQIEVQMKNLVEFLSSLEQKEELTIDVFFNLILKNTDSELRFKAGNPRFLVRYFLKGEMAFFSESNQGWLSLVPYFTIKGNNLSFNYNMYDKEAYNYFRNNKNRWRAISKAGKNRNIWIVGERSYKAQDNGYRFFKYLRKNHPEIEAYYVISKDSPERKNVEPYGNVIDFYSKEHFQLMMQASYICGTHHPSHIYPTRNKQYVKNIKAKKVFLQHGVFGTKNISPFYGKWLPDFETDMFVTSSEKEKNIAVRDLGYEQDEVAVTGLSRFESLFKDDIPLKRQVLIIPTWRDWITNNQIFEESDYFKRYEELLFDPRLKEISEKYNIELIFCLHPNMQDYVDYFADAPVTIIKQGERDVQVLIKESMVMVTDYSSVAFDFSFLHKPVIYYQFDRKKFLGKHPSHLDNELPGDIAFEKDEVIDSLFKVGKNNFEMENEYVEKANNFIQYRDTKSNEPIFEAIQNIPERSKFKTFLKEDPLPLKIFSRFRRSKYYFPTMKLYYKILSRFSRVVDKRVLFESGVGKRYEDSPRAIYEKMVENEEDFEFIWVMNNNEPLNVNSNTKVIKRLSPSYYKYLATSKYWVNNQNFPTYLTKPKQTQYLQTWHGTPLKKMQHDQDQIEGRDEGYLDRVTHAKNQWSALVSPSPYATHAFRSAFQYNGPVLELGYPRNDVFYEPNIYEKRESIRQKLNIAEDEKVILYAPTFRDNQKKGKKFTMKNKINFRIFERRLGEDYVLLIREHVVVASKLNIPEEFRHNIINVSKYPDIQELMIASDILVTDYSSVMFDYANTNKPMYFYCYDLDEYGDMRGFYFDLEEQAPGPIVKNTSNLFRSIASQDQYWDNYGEKYQAFQTRFAPLDGPNRAEKVYKAFFKR